MGRVVPHTHDSVDRGGELRIHKSNNYAYGVKRRCTDFEVSCPQRAKRCPDSVPQCSEDGDMLEDRG